MTGRFEIVRLGAQGDGVAETETGPVFIPYTLPGEIVTAARAKDRAELIAIQEVSPQRIEPACRHFGACGGCAIQHLEQAAYLGWKREKVVQALRGLPVGADAIRAIVPCAPHTRRRVTLTARKAEGGMQLGYNRHLSNDIVDIVECPISVPEIVAALAPLRALAGLICSTPKSFRLIVTATASGLDIAVHDAGKQGDAQRRIATNFVISEGFARLTVDDEIIVEPRKPVVMFGDVSVTLPPGAFLQATAFAEAGDGGSGRRPSFARKESRRPVCRQRQLCAEAGKKGRGACGRGRCRSTRGAGPRLSLRHRPEARHGGAARPVPAAFDL